MPVRPDGTVVGNGLILAAVGARFREGKLWPTAISHLKGPTMGFRTLAEPYQKGGGEYTSACPAHDFLLEIDGKALATDATDRRRLRLVAGSAISSALLSAADVELATIDFAPVAPRVPAIVRAVKITNRGPRARVVSVYPYLCYSGRGDAARYDCAEWDREIGVVAHGRSISYTALNRGRPPDKPFVLQLSSDGPVEWGAVGDAQRSCWESILSGVPTRGRSSRAPFDGALKIALGTISPGSSLVFRTFLITACARDEADSYRRQIMAENPEHLLGETHAWWQSWIHAPLLETSSRRINHLIDGLQVLNAAHRTADGQLFNGFPLYGLAMWTRDSYDQQRALLKAGKRAAALEAINRFMECWERYGTSNSYHLDEIAGDGVYAGYYELPALHALLVRDFMEWVGDHPERGRLAAYAAGAADEIRLTENHLCRLSGDETWTIPSVTNRMAEVPDNSIAAAMALETAFSLTGDPKFQKQSGRVRKAITDLLVARNGRFVHFRTRDGTVDERPITNMLTRGLMLGYCESADPVARKSAEAAWRYNRTDDGVVKEDPLAVGFPGNATGYLLYSFAELDSCAGKDLFPALLDLASASGTFWEFYFTTDRNTSGERLRSWDSASCLEGLLHWIYGISADAEGVRIAPRLPSGVEWIRVNDFPVRSWRVSYTLSGEGLRVSLGGQEVLRASKAMRLRVTDRMLSVRPFGNTPPYLDTPPITYDRAEKRLVLSPSMGNLELSLDGIACSFTLSSSSCRVEVRNDAALPITAALGDMEHLIRPGARQVLSFEDEAANVDFALMSAHHQVIQSVEPLQAFLLRGRTYGSRGVPFCGPVTLGFAGRRIESLTDDLGYFEVSLEAPLEEGDRELAIQAKSLQKTFVVPVIIDPLNRIDGILAMDGLPACSILAATDDGSIRAAWEIWYAAAQARAVSLPLFHEEKDCAGTHIIQIGGGLPKDVVASSRDGYSFTHQNGFYRFILPVSPDVRDLQPFLNAINTNIRAPAGAANLVKYRGGCAPGITAMIDCKETDSLWIGDQRCTSGRALSLPAAEGCPQKTPFARVFLQGTTLVVEADSPSPIKVRVLLRIPQGASPSWQWSQYVDPVEDSIDVTKGADGGHTIEITLAPGKPLEEKRADRKRTCRRAEFDVAEYLPEWYHSGS